MSLQTVDVPLSDVAGDALRLHLGVNTLPAVASRLLRINESRAVIFEVLAASHRITVRASGGRVLTETVACGSRCDVDAPPVAADRLPSRHTSVIDGGNYEFSSSRLDGADAVREAAQKLRALKDHPHALVVEFPGHGDALTGLMLDHVAGAITWSTWHLYPGPTAHAVATTTILTQREAP